MAERTIHRLSIGGMSCAACVATVEKALRGVPGVAETSVNFAEHTAQVRGEVDATALLHAVADAGYAAAELSGTDDELARREAWAGAEYRTRMQRAAMAALIGVPLLVGGRLGWLPPYATNNGQVFWLAAAVATFMVLSYSGRHFFVAAWRQLRHRTASMDTLVALGIAIAWCYSTAVVFAPHSVPAPAQHAYFAAVAMIVALLDFGSALELRARGRTAAAATYLGRLLPQTARVVREGHELDVAVAEVAPGDTLRVRQGERLPVDGVIIDGCADLDESLGGEPLMVTKRVGDEVMGGTLNRSGTFLYRAANTGKEALLARIIERVHSAQASRPALGRLVERGAVLLVPGVLVVAVAAFLLWYSFGPGPGLFHAVSAAVAVLIIACPSALGLAVPLPVMLGVGRAAEQGVLIRDGETLQRVSRLTTIVLDKAGTLTTGRPRVTAVVPRGWLNADQLLEIAATVAAASQHPLAAALVAATDQKGMQRLELSGLEAVSGRGVLAWMNRQRIVLGNRRWMEDNHVAVGELALEAERLAADGQEPLLLALNNLGAGVIAVSDPIKDDATAAVARMREAGLKVVMLTGDCRETAAALARRVGIDAVMAEVSLQDRDKRVAELRGRGEIVGTVGERSDTDPVAVRSDVGFALGRTEAGVAGADVTLLRGSLLGVADAVTLCRATVRNIKQNLWGASLYTVLGISVAAGAFYALTGVVLNPMLAAAAVALSSLAVMGNAGRLSRMQGRA